MMNKEKRQELEAIVNDKWWRALEVDKDGNILKEYASEALVLIYWELSIFDEMVDFETRDDNTVVEFIYSTGPRLRLELVREFAE